MPTATVTEIATLKSALESQGVKYALASYVDIHGMSKAKMVPLSHLEQMMQGSELFTGAALDGVPQDISDEEVAALPDLQSATVLPWNQEVVWFASDLYLAGQPFEACCRSILKRMLEKVASLGFTFNLGIETEFFVFREDEFQGFGPVSDRDTLAKPCYDLTGLLDNYGWLTEL
ncbi:MAG: type III glutamate--ammonia ligase, partial [Cyanobacteria bacterium P01_A01_bin.70]